MRLQPPIYSVVIRLPVPCLEPRTRFNRAVRRKHRWGRQHRWDKLRGMVSPKEMRESGL